MNSKQFNTLALTIVSTAASLLPTSQVRASVSGDAAFLPFDAGATMTVTAGYNNGANHANRYNNFAVDFAPSGVVSARASRRGTVVVAGWNEKDGYGNRVIIRYTDGTFGFYAHLASIYVKQNSSVVGGQGVGQIGATGWGAQGVHLHYSEGSTVENMYVVNLKPLPQLADAPNANFNTWNFRVTSNNPDGRNDAGGSNNNPANTPSNTPSTSAIEMVNFTATTSNDRTNVRSAPSTSGQIVAYIAPRTKLSFDAWVYGVAVPDIYTNKPDRRWYRIAGTNNWVASAVVWGNAPGSTP